MLLTIVATLGGLFAFVGFGFIAALLWTLFTPNEFEPLDWSNDEDEF